MSQLRDSLPKPHPHGEDEGTEGSYERTLKNHNNYIKTKLQLRERGKGKLQISFSRFKIIYDQFNIFVSEFQKINFVGNMSPKLWNPPPLKPFRTYT